MKSLIKSARTYLTLTVLAAGMIGLNSCNDDILELTPLDRISEVAVFTDEAFLTNYVNGNYRGIRQHFEPDAGGYVGLTDIGTFQDETVQYNSSAIPYREGNLTPDLVEVFTRGIGSSNEVFDMWQNSYGFIRRINVFFENTEGNTDLDVDRLRILTGESAFQRAYIYFELLRHFGGVPLLTSSVALDEAEGTQIARASYDEVAQFVLSELDKSAQLLAGEEMESGRASQAAALALKARMLLYMASPLNNPSNDVSKWQAAEAAHEAVFDLGFSLHPDHIQVQREPIKADEVIFGREYTIQNGTESQAFGIAWGYNYDFWPAGFDAQQKQVPTQRFVNMHQMANGEYPYLDENFTLNAASGHDPQNPFVDRDPRFYFNILYPGAPVNIIDGGRTTERTYEYWEDANPDIPDENPDKVDPINGQDLFDFGRDSRQYWIDGRTPFHWDIQTGYTFNKLLDFNGPRADFQFDYNNVTTFIRLAEMYLNYAEIQIALGNEDEARNYINLVRARPSVNMPPITASGDELIEVYRKERAVELALEDHRFWDLYRWKAGPGHIDINPVNGLKSVTRDWSDGGKFSFEYGPIVEQREPWPGDFYYLLPIPRDEINRTGIEQNPGYQ